MMIVLIFLIRLEVYERLYHFEWRTNHLVPATLQMTVSVRGFLGDYRIRIIQGSEVLSELEFTLDQDLEISCTGTLANITCSLYSNQDVRN